MKRTTLNRWHLGLLTAVGLTLISCSTSRSAASAPKTLFNGKDLTGWKAMFDDASVKPESVWWVQDGVLVCKGEPLGCLVTTENYINYKLEVEYRWAPGKKPGNSGIFGRGNGPARGLPRCLETQLHPDSAGDVLGLQGMKVTGDSARVKLIPKHAVAGDINLVGRLVGAERPHGEWNKVEILAQGDRVTVWFNGTKVNEAHGAEVIPGPVGLQSEGGEIHFRNVRITPME